MKDTVYFCNKLLHCSFLEQLSVTTRVVINGSMYVFHLGAHMYESSNKCR